MFGHDNNNDNQQNDQMGSNNHVMTPADPAQDASLGLGGVSTAGAPTVAAHDSNFGADPTPSLSSPAPSPTPSLATHTDPDDLITIKQEALQHLSPLVNHLDQTPEEKFRTLMMMIQAADDQSKLKEAYEIAKEIPDEKVRAQALLDVVNEINYFTQQHNKA